MAKVGCAPMSHPSSPLGSSRISPTYRSGIMSAMDFLIAADLETGLDHVRAAPADAGTLELIVARPAQDDRVALEEGDFILLATADDRTPETAWRYLDMTELYPDRIADDAASPAEFEKLRDAILEYYADRGLWFDTATFLEYFDIMSSLEN